MYEQKKAYTNTISTILEKKLSFKIKKLCLNNISTTTIISLL